MTAIDLPISIEERSKRWCGKAFMCVSPTDAVNRQVIYHAIKCEGAQMGVFIVLTG